MEFPPSYLYYSVTSLFDFQVFSITAVANSVANRRFQQVNNEIAIVNLQNSEIVQSEKSILITD